MSKSMIPTPLTDAVAGQHNTFHGIEFVTAEFARKLERDRARLVAALKDAKAELAKASELNAAYFEAVAILRELGEA